MRSQIRASVQGFHSSHDASSPSAARQPQPIPHGMKTSKALSVAKHAIPLCPFANKTKCQEHAIFSSHLRSFRTPISFLSCTFIVTRVVLFPELAFRLQPLVEVLVQIVTVTSTFDVNLMRSPMDFVQGWQVLASFFRNVRPETAWPCVLSIHGLISQFHSLLLTTKVRLAFTERASITAAPSGLLVRQPKVVAH